MRNLKSIYHVFVILLFALLFTSCESSTEPEEPSPSLPAISVDWDSSNTIVCFGTSITKGEAQSALSYPALLDDELVIDVVNSGIWGSTADKGIEWFDNLVLSKNPALVILEFGANEFLQQIDVNVAEANIDSLIRMLNSNDIKVVMLSFINPEMIENTSPDNPLYDGIETANAYYSMLVGLANKYNLLIDDYIYRDIWGNPTLLMPDGVHPNDKGNQILKENIFNSFYNTFEANGMLK